MAFSVILADDHEVVRAGLKSFLRRENVCILGEAATGLAAWQLVKEHRPDLALLDVRMPEWDGLACLARIKADIPTTNVLMLSSFDFPNYMARAIALGALGYLLKNASRSEIVAAVNTAAKGDSIWSEKQRRRFTGGLISQSGVAINIPFTKRESEVMKQLALGLINREIAQALGISFETVKEHVQHILRKLGVTDRTQAAVWAARNKLM